MSVLSCVPQFVICSQLFFWDRAESRPLGRLAAGGRPGPQPPSLGLAVQEACRGSFSLGFGLPKGSSLPERAWWRTSGFSRVTTGSLWRVQADVGVGTSLECWRCA